MSQLLASIPSPPEGVWYLGPVPIRAYSMAILLGIVIAIVVGERRWRDRGGPPGTVIDVAVWAVPFGIVGGRLYHVVSSPSAYFGPGGDPIAVLYIWEGGLGIWGAIALGAVGAWIGARRAGMKFAPLADSIAPGLLLAQAIGRFGNYFNQELFGSPTTLPWGLEIDLANRPEALQEFTTFHPTFLYEALWNVLAFAILVWRDRRAQLGHGRVFWGYVILYTLGRVWIEMLRVDPAETVLGVRLNVWTSVLLCVFAATMFTVSHVLWPGRETSVVRSGAAADDTADDETSDAEITSPPGGKDITDSYGRRRPDPRDP